MKIGEQVDFTMSKEVQFTLFLSLPPSSLPPFHSLRELLTTMGDRFTDAEVRALVYACLVVLVARVGVGMWQRNTYTVYTELHAGM